jgi:hypothetical protein
MEAGWIGEGWRGKMAVTGGPHLSASAREKREVEWAGGGCWAGSRSCGPAAGKKEKRMGGLLGWKEGKEVWILFIFFSFSTFYS